MDTTTTSQEEMGKECPSYPEDKIDKFYNRILWGGLRNWRDISQKKLEKALIATGIADSSERIEETIDTMVYLSRGRELVRNISTEKYVVQKQCLHVICRDREKNIFNVGARDYIIEDNTPENYQQTIMEELDPASLGW